MNRPALALGGLVLLLSILVAAVLGFILREGMRNDSERLQRENAVQVTEHREVNQADHDCIVALALLLANPERDRSAVVIPPELCQRSPAAEHQKEAP